MVTSLDHEKSFLYQDSASYVLAIGFYKDSLLVTVSNDIILKDILTGSIQRTFRAHDKTIYDFVLTNDSRLISAGFDDTIIVWDLITGSILKRIWLRTLDTRISSIAVQNDIAFAVGLDNMVRQVDLVIGRVVRTIDLVGYVYSVEFGGEYFYIGKKVYPFILKYSIRNFNSKDIFEGHTNTVLNLYLSNDILLSGSADTSVICWNAIRGAIIRILSGHPDLVQAVGLFDGCFAYKQSELFSGSLDAAVVKWDAVTGDALGIYRSRNIKWRAVANWRNIVISASEDIEIKFWDASIDSINLYGILYGHLRSINTMTIYEDSLFTGSSDPTVKQWDIISFSLQKTFEGPTVAITSVVIGQPFVYSSGYENTIYQWSVSSGLLTELTSLRVFVVTDEFIIAGTMDGLESFSVATGLRLVFKFEQIPCSCIISAYNRAYTGHPDGIIISRDFYTLNVLEVYQGHLDYVSSLSFDGSFNLFSAAFDGSIKKWNMAFRKVSFSFESRTKGSDIFSCSIDNASALKTLKYFNQSASSLIVFNGSFYAASLDGTLSRDGEVRTADFQKALVCIAATEFSIFAGSRSELKGHVAQVNSLLLVGEILFYGSDYKTIIEWSLKDRIFLRVYQRLSSSALGHLGHVNALSYCSGALLSAGSDVSARRWNTITGKHEDVYLSHLGFFKPVTTVLCHNGSLFAGSEDFSVLMFRPVFTDFTAIEISSSRGIPSKNSRKEVKIAQKFKASETSEALYLIYTLVLIFVAVLLIGLITVIIWIKTRNYMNSSQASTRLDGNSSTMFMDLETIVNSVMGISKPAAFLILSSMIAKVHLWIPLCRKKAGETAIQKVVYINLKSTKAAFFQEVGIMIMLSTSPHFCQIIGYTEKPLTMILKFYSDGSLYEWLRKNQTMQTLETIHSNYLAHCDIKTQNVLVHVENGVPACYLTGFGITQILSYRIVASKLFNVMNFRGLSVQYALPEAFLNFSSKARGGTDFKKYDVYSFACVMYEILTRKEPWHA
ncbi:hypothetical protein MP638_003027 [Amoeboaphelidium occidentale]|nr:hypothetical protein MP638_003027 [Amoeboaphelidium occidentale]